MNYYLVWILVLKVTDWCKAMHMSSFCKAALVCSKCDLYVVLDDGEVIEYLGPFLVMLPFRLLSKTWKTDTKIASMCRVSVKVISLTMQPTVYILVLLQTNCQKRKPLQYSRVSLLVVFYWKCIFYILGVFQNFTSKVLAWF